MRTFTVAVTSIVAFVTFIQPCPAPPAVAIAIGAAAAGSAAGGIVAGGVTAGLDRIPGKKTGKRDVGKPVPHMFRNCVADTTLAAFPQQIAVGTDTVVINNVPPSCMAQINAYNAHPNITDLTATHGSTTVINDTAIALTGVPDVWMKHLQDMAKTGN